MAVTPRSRYSTPVSILRTMLSNCTSVQKLFQAANAAAALASIHMFAKDDPTYPLCIVEPQQWSAEDVAGGASVKYVATGLIAALFEIPVIPVANGVAITAVTDASTFRASSLVALKDDHFNELTLTMLTGDYVDEAQTVSDFDGTTGEITLGSALSGAPDVGDTFKVAPADVADAYTWYFNVLGDIREELEALSGQGGYLALRNIRCDRWGLELIEDSEDEQLGMAGLIMDFGR